MIADRYHARNFVPGTGGRRKVRPPSGVGTVTVKAAPGSGSCRKLFQPSASGSAPEKISGSRKAGATLRSGTFAADQAEPIYWPARHPLFFAQLTFHLKRKLVVLLSAAGSHAIENRMGMGRANTALSISRPEALR